MEILLWDKELEDWSTDEWEEENSIPERVLVIIYVASEEEDEEPIVFERILDIPVAQSIGAKLKGPTKTN